MFPIFNVRQESYLFKVMKLSKTFRLMQLKRHGKHLYKKYGKYVRECGCCVGPSYATEEGMGMVDLLEISFMESIFTESFFFLCLEKRFFYVRHYDSVHIP